MNNLDFSFKFSNKHRNFDDIQGNLHLRIFFTKLMFTPEDITLKDIWEIQSYIVSMLMKIESLEEEVKELKNE